MSRPSYQVTYRYTVDGTTYQSFEAFTGSGSVDPRAYRVGTEIRACIDPEEPSQVDARTFSDPRCGQQHFGGIATAEVVE